MAAFGRKMGPREGWRDLHRVKKCFLEVYVVHLPIGLIDQDARAFISLGSEFTPSKTKLNQTKTQKEKKQNHLQAQDNAVPSLSQAKAISRPSGSHLEPLCLEISSANNCNKLGHAGLRDSSAHFYEAVSWDCPDS